jgi:hypothetical protein
MDDPTPPLSIADRPPSFLTLTVCQHYNLYHVLKCESWRVAYRRSS